MPKRLRDEIEATLIALCQETRRDRSVTRAPGELPALVQAFDGVLWTVLSAEDNENDDDGERERSIRRQRPSI